MEEFFAQNSYWVLRVGSADGLSATEAAHWQAMFDADRRKPGWTTPDAAAA
eukprot:SAG31_NODE_41963_length_273_cov_1.488506_1_plen_50_part_10